MLERCGWKQRGRRDRRPLTYQWLPANTPCNKVILNETLKAFYFFEIESEIKMLSVTTSPQHCSGVTNPERSGREGGGVDSSGKL